jgi:urease accessory protein
MTTATAERNPDGALPQRHQRSTGQGRLVVRDAAGKTRISRMFQEGSAKIRVPRYGERQVLEAVLINTSGGLTGGDRLDWEIEAGPGSQLTLTTQACEKVYRSTEGDAAVSARMTAGSGARVNWLPQETILFDGGRLARSLDADLAPGASLLALEAVILGRRAHGETVNRGLFRDRWRVRREGRLIHAEDARLDGNFEALGAKAAALGGCTALASVLLVSASAADLAGPARECIAGAPVAGGASAWSVAGSGKLLARIAASDGYALRKALLPLLRLLNCDAQDGAGLPRIWSI